MTELFNPLLKNPRGVHFESQEPNEKVYFILRRHPITNVGWIAFSLIGVFTPIIAMYVFTIFEIDSFQVLPAQLQFILIILWYLLISLFTFESFLIWYFNVYIITDRRVIDVDFAGFWGKRISEAPLDNVEDVTYGTSTFLHVLFDYGDIYMQTAAEKREFEFHSIPKPGIVHDKLTDLVEEYKKRHAR